MEWIQRGDLEYEFDLAGDMDKLNNLSIIKTRCRALNGAVFAKPGADLAQIIVQWLAEGAPSEVPTPAMRPKAPSQEPRPPMPGVNGRPVNTTEPALAQTSQDLILTIVSTLKARFPGEDATAKQDRSDLCQEYFGVPAIVGELKKLPLTLLEQGYARLMQPVTRPETPPPAEEEDEEDVPDATDQPVEGAAHTASAAIGGGDGPPQELDDEQATEALLLQLARYAEAQGMTPALQGLLASYDVHRLDDGVLILTAPERQLLYAQAQDLWPELTETEVQVF